jgi:hypothetical protein
MKTTMDDTIKKELQSAAFERLIQHLRERKDVQNLDLMNLAGFCRNCLSKWFREEAQKKGIEISDPDARKHIYGIPYPEWKKKYQK